MVNLQGKPFFLNKDDIEWVNSTLQGMSQEEKVGQLFCPIGLSAEPEDLQTLLEQYKPGGIMFRPSNAEETVKVHSYLQQNSKIPMLIAANLESGSNGAVVEGTEFGSQMQIGATADPQMAANLGAIVADEGRAVGCNWAFAPVIDIDYNFHNPITNTRTYGSNHELVGAMGKAYVESVQSRGMATSIKHFPGDGVDYRDQHLVLSYNGMQPEEWDKTYGYVYQESINAGALTVMIGHIALPEYSRKLNPSLQDKDIMPASMAPELLNDLLRDKLSFNGLIVSDATPMVGFTAVKEREKAVPLTIAAGCDVFLFNKSLEEDFGFMMKGIETGLLTMERVDEAVTRILATKASLGLHKEDQNASLDLTKVGCDEHRQMAAECADKAITLVKDTQGLLPISTNQHKKILLIGLGDEGDMFGQKTSTITKFQNRMAEEGFEINLYDTRQFTMRDMMQSVEDFVADYDLVLYAAQFKTASNKTTLRINWAPPMGIDAPWFSAEIPTAFISFGNPYHLMDVPRIPTYINAYTGNDHTIEAVVNKLLGRSEFTGISPVDAFVGQWDTRI